MKKIHILGTGCAKCNALTEAVKQAVAAADIPAEIEKVTDILRFADFGVMMTPALVVDGVVKATGKVPSPDELKKLLA
jgi:small redox-active disulfide protein 2